MRIEFKTRQQFKTAEFNTELDAAADYFERTNENYWNLDPVSQRKILEAWREKNDLHI